MDAMDYEFLLRRVYQCGRSEAKGADADIYNQMEDAWVYLTKPHGKKTQKQRRDDYRRAFLEVKIHVRNALVEGIKHLRSCLLD